METSSAIASSSSAIPVHCRDDDGNDGKQVVVRVKRKRQQAPIDALWLEINERPHKPKRQEREREMGLTLAQLSLADGQGEGEGEDEGMAKSRKLLFHHVETVSSSDKEKGFIESILMNAREDWKSEQSHKEQREDIKKSKDKQGQLRASARKQHENAAKNARFEQVWRSRKGIDEMVNVDAIHELCHLYDVVRVDVEEEMEATASRKEKAKSEAVSDHERQILCNFLPLMREHLPSAAAEVEAQLCSSGTTEQDYVYDVYTLQKEGNVAEDVVADYPLVQVEEEDDFYYGDTVESEADTEDSNDENNPLNDYPSDEESELDDKRQSSFFNESEEEDPFDEDDEDSDAFESNEEAIKWACRR